MDEKRLAAALDAVENLKKRIGAVPGKGGKAHRSIGCGTFHAPQRNIQGRCGKTGQDN